MKLKRKISLATKRSFAGYMFTLPFIIGAVLLFLSPFALNIKLSFSQYSASMAGMQLKDVGLGNYNQVLFIDNGFLKDTFSSLGYMLLTCPAILIFSFFVANILNKKFKGRTFVRIMFFLPFIATTGIAQMLLSSDFFGGVAGTNLTTITSNMGLTKAFLASFGTSIDNSVLQYFSSLVSQIYIIITSSSMQIIIFLAGLQTISPSLYEASSIEGSSSWEDFWKITLPMISPLIIVNAAYTLIDSLAGSTNTMVMEIYDITMGQARFGYGAAMGLLYFGIVFAILGLVIVIINRFVFYENR
jgi:ABC-type sugar transport system permease subunit